jgi:hypothetical protein
MRQRTVLQMSEAEHLRVTVDARADLVFPLRDYFRRLGVQAEVRGPTVVELETDIPADEVEVFAHSWSQVNAVPATLERPGQAPAPAVVPIQAAAPAKPAPPRLGELLIKKGFITEDQLKWALSEARETGDLVGIVLLRRQLIFEDELARTLSDQLQIPYISIMRIGVNPYVARLLPADVGERAAAIPVRASGHTVQVVFADPTDVGAVEQVEQHLPHIEIAVAELSDIKLAWREVRQMRFADAR